MRARKVLRWWHRAAALSGWRVCRWHWPAPAQCASHVAVEPQSPAEPEHCRLGDIALPGQRGNGEILRFVRMLQQVVGDRVAGSGQLVLSLMQQFPKICTHGQAPSSRLQCPHYSLCFLLPPSAAQGRGHFYKKSIKEVWPLDKCAFRHNSEEKAVQSIQKTRKSTTYY